MSEEEKRTQAEIIEEIITRKMRPVYWSLAIMLTIFITVAAPLTGEVIGIKVDVEKQIESTEVYQNFLTKTQYHILQKDEHGIDIQAVKHPEQSDYLYMEHNVNEAERLEIRYRSNN